MKKKSTTTKTYAKKGEKQPANSGKSNKGKSSPAQSKPAAEKSAKKESQPSPTKAPAAAVGTGGSAWADMLKK